MVIHFGINPDSGGSPPRDKSNNGTINCRIGALAISLFMSKLVAEENLLKMRKIGVISRV